MLAFFLFLSLSQFSVSANSEPTIITENTEEMNLNAVAEYLEDARGNLTVQELHNADFDHRFRNIDDEVLNVGITRSVIWIRFDLRYLSHVGEGLGLWLIEVGYPALDLVTLYVEDPWEGFLELHSGDKHPFDIRAVAHPGFLFPVELRAGESRRFYLRIESSGSMQVPLKLWTPLAFVEKTIEVDILLGMICGILLVMFFYNFVLWLTVRDVSYLYYIVYIGAFLLYQISVNGLGLAVLWQNYPVINSAAPFFMSIAGVAGLLFAHEFLGISLKSRWLEKLYSVMLVAGFIIMPLSLLVDYGIAVRLVMVQVLPTLPVLMLSGLYFWLFRGDASARLFFIAFSVLLVGGMVHGLMLMGHLPSNAITKYSVPVGLTIEVTLLSLALASRFRLLRKAVKEAQLEAKGRLERANQRLVEGNRLKDDFIHAVSHELKTPMGTASLSLDILSESAEPEQEKLLHTARQSVQDMSAIISNLLKLTEIYSGAVSINVAPFNIRRQLDMLLERYQPACNKKEIVLKCYVEESVPDILYGDTGKLFRALSYLVDNAVKFTDSGEIHLTTIVRDHDQSDKVRLYITVEDSGPGVQAKRGQDIYQAFQKGEADRYQPSGETGLGLGLSLCRQLMHFMGGTVSHSARDEGGAAFELSLTCRKSLRQDSSAS